MVREFTRRQLYDLVWSRPISALSAEFGISDRSLAKLCARYNIPVPSRGYWAKVSAGQKARQPTFHPTPHGKPDKVAIGGNLPPPAVREVIASEKKRRSVSEKPAVTVEEGDNLHRAILLTSKALRKTPPDAYGAIYAFKEGHCGICVGKDSVERVISLLDNLARRIFAEGMILTPSGRNMKVAIGNDSVEFSIVEKVEREKHTPTAEELAREIQLKRKQERDRFSGIWEIPPSRAYPETDFIRTGILSAEIKHEYTGSSGLRRNWRDSRKPLEKQIEEIVSGLKTYIAAVRERRLESEERERVWKREARIRDIGERYNARENARVTFIQALAETSAELEKTRSVIRDIELKGPPSAGTRKMLEWAKEYALWLEGISSQENIAEILFKEELFPDTDHLLEELEGLGAGRPAFRRIKPEPVAGSGNGYSGHYTGSSWKPWYRR